MGGEPTRRQDRGDEFAEQGQLDEALDEYLWCWDNGELIEPPYHGVRSTFLLGSIERLSGRLPRAREELERRCAAAEQLLIAGQREYGIAHDFAALGHTLGDDARTLRLFDRLVAAGTLTRRVAQALGRDLANVFIEQRRYEHLLSTQCESTLESVRWRIELHRQGDAESAKFHSSMNERLAGAARNAGINLNEPALNRDIADQHRKMQSVADARLHKKVVELANFYEAELGAGSAEQADQIADLVLDYAPNSRAFTELIRRAVRAGAPDRARRLADRALQTFPSEEHALIRAALESPPQ